MQPSVLKRRGEGAVTAKGGWGRTQPPVRRPREGGCERGKRRERAGGGEGDAKQTSRQADGQQEGGRTAKSQAT